MSQGLILPSYQQGYARGPDMSLYPQTWRGLVGAWVPALGRTGDTLFDVSGFGNHGTLESMIPNTEWQLLDGNRLGDTYTRPTDLLNFNQGGDHINIPDDARYDFIVNSQDFSVIMWLATDNDTDNNQRVMCRTENSTNADGWQFIYDGSVSDTYSFVTLTGGTQIDIQSIVVDTGVHMLVGGWNAAGSTVRMSLDGLAQSGIEGGTIGLGDDNTFFIARRRASNTHEWNGKVLAMFVYNRDIGIEEDLLHFRNPLAPLILRPRVIAVRVPAAVGDITMAADAGTFALSGQNVTSDISMSVATDSFALTGQAATFDIGQLVDSGTYSFAGQNITVDLSVSLTPGTYAFSGQNITSDLAMLASAGIYAYSGQNVTVDISMSAVVGAYTFTGQDVATEVSGDVIMAADSGAFVFNGADVTTIVSAGAGKLLDVSGVTPITPIT